MTRMHNPPHPGAVLQDTVLRADGGLTVTEFAKRLRVSRVALSRVVHGHAAKKKRPKIAKIAHMQQLEHAQAA